MKTKIFACALILLFAAQTFSQIQSVKITPRKVVHRRANTSVSYKKRYTVVYPKISGVSRNLKQKIERNLRYEKTFNFYFTNGLDEQYQLLDKAAYRVLYNKNGILNLRFSIDVSAAYESHYDKSVAVNLKTGEIIKPEDIFIKAKLEKLAEKIDDSLQTEVEKTILEVERNEGESAVKTVETQIQDSIFTVAHLGEFKVSDKGITFIYDYSFSHITRNYEPPGEFFFSYAQLKPFIRRDGLLARFTR